MAHATRTAREWFDEEAHCYIEGHQACAWCGGRHRVFKTSRGSRLEYHCADCDFYVCHDEKTGAYAMEPGDGQAVVDSCGCIAPRSCLEVL
jgi:hypothetical protein